MKKIFPIILLMFVLLSMSVSALSLLAEWDPYGQFKTITPGESPGYWVEVINDIDFEYTDVSVNIYDQTTGSLQHMSQLYYERTTELFYFPDMFVLQPEDYGEQGGEYLIEVVADEFLYGSHIVRSEQIYLDAGNRAPRVTYDYIPESPVVGEVVTFTADAEDDDGEIVLYEWFVDGINQDVDNEVFEKQFPTARDYDVRVEVMDNEGATAEYSETVPVGQGNGAPYFTSTPITTGTVDQAYTYDADATDPDGDTLTYSLTTSPNGMNINLQTGLITWTPSSTGNYPVTVVATDNINEPTTQSYAIIVSEEENELPFANFTWSPEVPLVNEIVFFDGALSHDPDGTIEGYYWTIDNSFISNEQSFYHSFSEDGMYDVKLTVEDNDGATDSETKQVTVEPVPIPDLILDELGCNANVVQGHQQHCSAHVKELETGIDVKDATIKFYYVHNDEFLGDCESNFKGYCHINPIINKPVGEYEVYATAEKEGYAPDFSKLLRTQFKVWAERYIIENLQTWEDEFIIENYTFYRANPVYSSFDVLDLFTNQYVPPGSGLVEHVFVRVNNANPLNFTQIGEFQMKDVTSQYNQYDSERQIGEGAISQGAGDYRFWLDAIPITDDYLGEGKVFAFVFNFSDNTAGQDSVNVLILNNELEFETPGPYYMEQGTSINIDFNDYLDDVETPDDEIEMSYGDEWPFTVTEIGVNVFRVFAPNDFEGQHNILFTADDTDGSVETRSVLFVVSAGELFDPVAAFGWNPLNPLVGEDVIFTSTSYDPDGEIVSYLWKINGIEVSTEESFDYAFDNIGIYSVSLTVVDNDDLENTLVRYVTVGSISSDDPVAILKIPGSTLVGREVVMDGSESYDPNGHIIEYRWNIIHDNKIIESFVTTNPKVTYVFTEKYKNYVELTVVDNDNLTDSTTGRIDVGKQREQHNGPGKDDGLFVDYFEVFGLDRGVIRTDEPYTVSITVTNDRDEKLNNLHATFQIPEIGYVIKSDGFDLKAGKTKHIFIQDYLPFLPGDIEPGYYYALIGAAGDGVIRNKYYPLIIEE